MQTRPPTGRLHVLTDIRLQQRYSHLQLAQLAAAGGADVVQYREKNPPPPAQEAGHVRQLVQALAPTPCRVIINDRVDLALQSHAAGAHVGAEDEAPEQVSARCHPDFVLGVTIHSMQELDALKAKQLPVDYIGVGPVYGTASKSTGLPPLGLAGLAELAQASPWPVIAIGSITPERCAEVLAAGAWGVAVLGAVCCSPKPEAATRAFRQALDAAAAADHGL